MSAMASQNTSLTIVYATVYSGTDQRQHQSSASLAFMNGIHWSPVNSRTKGQYRGKCFHLMTSSFVLVKEAPITKSEMKSWDFLIANLTKYILEHQHECWDLLIQERCLGYYDPNTCICIEYMLMIYYHMVIVTTTAQIQHGLRPEASFINMD